jgi:hypothetical protein
MAGISDFPRVTRRQAPDASVRDVPGGGVAVSTKPVEYAIPRKVFLSPSVDAAVQRLAVEEGSSLSNILRRLVVRGVAQERKLYGLADAAAESALVGAEQ